VHLQRLVVGDDVRAHVIGNRVISVRISSDHVDYRRDRATRHRPWELADELSARLVNATGAQGLVFAGWDLKLDGDGRLWCLEANPMPGYKMYDRWLGGVISDALLDNLRAGESSGPRRWPRLAAMSSPVPHDPEAKLAWERALHEFCAGGRKATCTEPRDPAECSCRSKEKIARRCEEIDEASRVIDSRLEAAAGWRGLLRRQVQGYALAGEPGRYACAFDWLACQQPSLDEELLRELHDRAVGGREFRDTELSPTAGFRFPSPSLLQELVADVCAQACRPGPPAAAAAALHLDMLTVHPYPDGNGRACRLLASALLMRTGYRSTVLTAVEEFFHPAPRRYVELLDRYRFAKICREACILGLIDAMFLASAGARWFFRREQAVDDAMRAVGLDPVDDIGERQAVESGAIRTRGSRLHSELRHRGLSTRRDAMCLLSVPGRAVLLAQVDRVTREQRESVPSRR
jgi:hypothetical protein